jgi:hypothetical protein
MWESIAAMFNELPALYRMVILPCLIICGVWVFSHLKRDKQGKLYWHSNIYEQKKHTGKIDKVLDSIKDLSVNVNKLTFYNNMLPPGERLFAGLHYIKNGGNGEVKEDVLKFSEEHKELYRAILANHKDLDAKIME